MSRPSLLIILICCLMSCHASRQVPMVIEDFEKSAYWVNASFLPLIDEGRFPTISENEQLEPLYLFFVKNKKSSDYDLLARMPNAMVPNIMLLESSTKTQFTFVHIFRNPFDNNIKRIIIKPKDHTLFLKQEGHQQEIKFVKYKSEEALKKLVSKELDNFSKVVE